MRDSTHRNSHHTGRFETDKFGLLKSYVVPSIFLSSAIKMMEKFLNCLPTNNKFLTMIRPPLLYCNLGYASKQCITPINTRHRHRINRKETWTLLKTVDRLKKWPVIPKIRSFSFFFQQFILLFFSRVHINNAAVQPLIAVGLCSLFFFNSNHFTMNCTIKNSLSNICYLITCTCIWSQNNNNFEISFFKYLK